MPRYRIDSNGVRSFVTACSSASSVGIRSRPKMLWLVLSLMKRLRMRRRSEKYSHDHRRRLTDSKTTSIAKRHNARGLFAVICTGLGLWRKTSCEVRRKMNLTSGADSVAGRGSFEVRKPTIEPESSRQPSYKMLGLPLSYSTSNLT